MQCQKVELLYLLNTNLNFKIVSVPSCHVYNASKLNSYIYSNPASKVYTNSVPSDQVYGGPKLNIYAYPTPASILQIVSVPSDHV